MKKILQPLYALRIPGMTLLMSFIILSASSQSIVTNFNATSLNVSNGINEDASLSVFPNPVADEAKLVFTSSKYDTPYQVRVVNNSGILLTNIKGTTVQGQNSIRIHVGNYPAGIYYIQLLTPDGKETLKLLKQPLNSL